MTGSTPSSSTLKMSIPVGVPRKPNSGIWKTVFSPAVIRYISWLRLIMASAEPPWYSCSDSAQACANPPRPTVSVIVLSPPIQVISDSSCPGNSFALGGSACGPRNHSSPSPATRIANSRQLNAMADTTLEPGQPCDRVRGRLGRGHRQPQEEVVVLGDVQERLAHPAAAWAGHVQDGAAAARG